MIWNQTTLPSMKHGRQCSKYGTLTHTHISWVGELMGRVANIWLVVAKETNSETWVRIQFRYGYPDQQLEIMFFIYFFIYDCGLGVVTRYFDQLNFLRALFKCLKAILKVTRINGLFVLFLFITLMHVYYFQILISWCFLSFGTN